MAFSISGKLTEILPPVTGLTKAGNKWIRQEILIEGGDGRLYCLSAWNKELTVTKSKKVFASFEIDSREYNGKYYTTLSLIALSELDTGTQKVKEPTPTSVETAPSPLDTPPSHSFTQSNDSDLPF